MLCQGHYIVKCPKLLLTQQPEVVSVEAGYQSDSMNYGTYLFTHFEHKNNAPHLSKAYISAASASFLRLYSF